ncbi:MAG: hypothetical protein MI807_05710 [Verrucomicrobiales bacterium]|nr:hypothetical protein [Verrucomicrobiales bacterium]
MNGKTSLSLLLAGLFLAQDVSAGANTEGPGGRFASLVSALLNDLKQSTYQGRTEIDEKRGIWNCDCSGLMSYMLRNHFPEAYLTLDGEEAPWRSRPLAVTFYESFLAAGNSDHSIGPWMRIRRFEDALPGDVLAWRKDGIVKGKSTGHVLMIASSPVQEEDGRFRVRVIDSTRGIHANDTRPEGSFGVGAGDMWFTVDEDGEPDGFYVSDTASKSTRPVAMGRMVRVSGASLSKGTLREDEKFIGLRKSAAIELARKSELKFRIIEDEGKVFPVGLSLSDDRLNFVISKDRVLRVIRG